jgi:chromosome segregation ATPase
MKFSLRILIVVAALVSLPGLFSSCDRKDPEETQKELKEAQRGLAEMQASLRKMRADINNVQTEKKLLDTRLEKAQTELAPALKASDQFKQQADALAADLEKTKAKIASVTKSLDELQQQISTLRTLKNDALPKVNTQASSAAPAYQPTQTSNQSPAKPQYDPALAIKLQEADSYVQAGNWQAAERLFLEIQKANPNYPGLDALNSRVQNMKTRINK